MSPLLSMERVAVFGKECTKCSVRPIIIHIFSPQSELKLAAIFKRYVRFIECINQKTSVRFDKSKERLWKPLWKGMPRFENRDVSPYKSIIVYMKKQEDIDTILGAKILNTKILNFKGVNDDGHNVGQNRGYWFPKRDSLVNGKYHYVGAPRMNPRYPVYIISKGRYDYRHTAKALDKMKVPYHIVVEPQEYEQYKKYIRSDKILKLPFSNLGQGSIPARNWVWKHAKEKGFKRHWILDDNIRCFYRRAENKKIKVSSGNIFRAAEDFVDRYENIALAGFNYQSFAIDISNIPPFYLNTRIYSCILIKNDIPFAWRGKYNEDTDLSLRVLKHGMCTVLFNAFLCHKLPTMAYKGGNTEEVYKNGKKRADFVKSLIKQHPDVVKMTVRIGRPHHQVNYSGFKDNKLILRPGVKIPNHINNYGMVLRQR